MKWLVAAVVVAGCTAPNPTKNCSEGMCRNPEFPYCDTEGVVSGEAGTCISVTCTPGEIMTCLGNDAFTCTATGDGYERVPCELGCSDAPAPHCKYIEPRYVPDVCDSPAGDVDFIVDNNATLDPNLDSSCSGGIVAQTAAPAICVLHYRRVTIAAGSILKIAGKRAAGLGEASGRPIALVADEDLSIDGVLDVSADGTVSGPGGGVVISGGRAELVAPGAHKAAGGAGGKTAGSAGGASEDGAGGSGGLQTADPALLPVLIGGAAGGGFPAELPQSGGGGGAALLVSCKGNISIAGTIDAGGGGGAGGVSLFGGAAPAYGGGAGGYVVLQANRVLVSGSIFANGGGGGSGTQADQTPGANGKDGSRSVSDGALGHTGANGAGRGGTGGTGLNVPTVGGKPTVTEASAGGGAGSVGFLQTYTPEGITPMITSTTISPRFQPNLTSKTR